MVHLRRLHLALTVVAVLVVIAVSMSDGVVPAVAGGFTSVVDGISGRVVDATVGETGTPTPTSPDVPIGWDDLTHFMLWFVVGLLAAGLVRRGRHVPLLFIGLLTLSTLVELAQQAWTDGRRFEFGDLLANGAGIGSGMAVGFVVVLVEVGALRLVRHLSRFMTEEPRFGARVLRSLSLSLRRRPGVFVAAGSLRSERSRSGRC